MGYGEHHPLTVVDPDGSGIGIGGDIVVIEHRGRVACLKILHPRVGEGEAEHECPDIIILEHKDVVGRLFLYAVVHRDDVDHIARRFRHLAKADDEIVAELVRLLVFHIFYDDAELLCITFLPAKSLVAHLDSRVQNCFSQSFADVWRIVERL